MVKSFIHEDRLQISDQNVYPKYPEALCVAIYIFNSFEQTSLSPMRRLWSNNITTSTQYSQSYRQHSIFY